MFCCEPRHGFGILLGLVFLLAVVSVTTVVSVHATRTLIANNSRVEHTRIVAQELDATLTALLNVETGERGYLYTGEKHYLEPYEIGRSEMDGHLRRLATLTVDNPVQQHNLARLQHSTQEAMDFFEQAVGFEAAGQEVAAKKLLLTGGGNAKMDAVRAVLGDMRAEELRLLDLRLEESQQSARYLLLAIPGSQAFTAALLLLAGLLVRRNLRKRGETARRFQELAEREHQAMQMAVEANERTESLLSSISEMFLLLDDKWNILYVNDQALRFSGRRREELVGKQYWSVFPETLGTKFEVAYRHAMETHKPEAFEAFDASLRKWFSVQLYPSPEALTIFAQDITAVKQAQAALVRSEKLAAVGRMAATVAHEINNPLEAVTNLIWIASKDPSISETGRESLRVADSELKRVAHITRQTLGFYRDSTSPAMVNMREVMNSVLELYASRVASKQISIHTDYQDCVVYGFAGEFRQLFSNLCANAIDAVKTAGKLRVKVSEVHHWKEPNQSGVRVTVADDGCGVPPEHLDSIFEPFFTTKDSTGTGLGLWVAKQIVEKHGGCITVRSSVRPNQHYTAVSVFLPSYAEVQHKTLAATAPAESN